MDLVDKMMALFSGYTKAHGRYAVAQVQLPGAKKAEGKAWTAHGPATREVWEEHLTGKGAGLGVIPLRDDDTVLFAAIDIDRYPLDHAHLEQQLGDLPLTLCRSKSGGAHLYLFGAEPLPAKEVIAKLNELAAALGYGGAEVFPKQHSRVSERDFGNWINLPYYDFEKTMRYALRAGQPLEIEDFVAAADSRRVTYEQLVGLELRGNTKIDDELLFEGPPCLQRLADLGGFGEGARNEGMFNVAVYLRKRFPDSWQDHLGRYNLELCLPPLSLGDVNGLTKSVGKKGYEYRCNQPPIKSYCNRRLCLQRDFGVGSGGNRDIEITSVTKYDGDPVLWGIELGGERVLVDTKTLYSQTLFNQLCMDRLSRCPGHVPSARWFKYLDEKLKDADVVPSPEDANPEGQFWLLYDQFISGRVQARRLEEVLLGKPYRVDGEVLFRSSDLFKYLEERRFHIPSHHKVWQWLKSHGADKRFHNLKGKGVNLWVLKAEPLAEDRAPLPEQTEVF